MSAATTPRIATLPRTAPWIDEAVVAGGGEVVPVGEATAVVWTHNADPDGLAQLLAAHPAIDWVQLPWAGVDPYRPLFDRDRTWSCAKGVYARPVAEHALALLLASFRHLPQYARERSWGRQAGRNLFGARVTVVGGGGIAEAFLALLVPFGCDVTVVRRRAAPVAGADRVLGAEELHEGLRGADAVVLALPLLDATRGLLGAAELALLAPGAVVVNVARGEHVDADALLAALEAGQVGGAGLDVTDPEPLPDGHPLWDRPEVLVTPHTANTQEMARPLLSARITENVRRYAEGRSLVGLVDVDAGY